LSAQQRIIQPAILAEIEREIESAFILLALRNREINKYEKRWWTLGLGNCWCHVFGIFSGTG
jgi:hypothetical protein